jgi:predicted secreted Zn-dependent protease
LNPPASTPRRILGIDPGLMCTGFGVVEQEGKHLHYVASPILVFPIASPAGDRYVFSMAHPFRLALTALLMPLAAPALAWTPSERIEHYRISGATPAALYASIGERGPHSGKGRAIALTTFRLTWKRDYRRRGEDCVLAEAIPNLAIIYHVPVPGQALSGATRAGWDRFAAGIERHERVHGDHIKAMVQKIEAATVGFTMAGDPDCKKIREAIKLPLKALSDEQREASRNFDRQEMSAGGAVHQLILDFLNGTP